MKKEIRQWVKERVRNRKEYLQLKQLVNSKGKSQTYKLTLKTINIILGESNDYNSW